MIMLTKKELLDSIRQHIFILLLLQSYSVEQAATRNVASSSPKKVLFLTLSILIGYISKAILLYSGMTPGYCATLKTLSSFSLNAAISRPILSSVMRA